MKFLIKIYKPFLLFVLFVSFLTSCQKGGEPVPCSNGVDIDNSVINKDKNNTSKNDKGGEREEGDNTIIGGDDNEDDDINIIGGDDNEDDDGLDATGELNLVEEGIIGVGVGVGDNKNRNHNNSSENITSNSEGD